MTEHFPPFGPAVAVGLAIVLVPISTAFAHQELYHNVDVDLVDAVELGVVSVYFTIHAPELLVGFDEASDAMFDKRWLSERTDAELERIVKLSRDYLKERFVVGFDKSEDPMDLAAEVVFDKFERIRSAVARKELPPACLLAKLRLDIPRGASDLHFGHRLDSDKRLLLVVIRPKAFPEVIDVEAGEAAVVELPAVEGAERKKDNWIYAAIVVAMLVAMGFLQVRRGKRLVEQKLVRRG